MPDLSLRTVIQTLYGRRGDVSLGRDLFGLSRGRVPSVPTPRDVSVRRYLATVRGPYVDLNFILIGSDQFTDQDDERIDYALLLMREIFEKGGIGVGRIGWFGVDTADAGAFSSPTDVDQLAEMTHRWSGPGRAVDVFVPHSLRLPAENQGDLGGISPVPGPCDKSSKDTSGVVVGLSASADDMAVVLPHECGHYLGLHHDPDPMNVMYAAVVTDPGSVRFTAQQGLRTRLHCMLQPGVEL